MPASADELPSVSPMSAGRWPFQIGVDTVPGLALPSQRPPPQAPEARPSRSSPTSSTNKPRAYRGATTLLRMETLSAHCRSPFRNRRHGPLTTRIRPFRKRPLQLHSQMPQERGSSRSPRNSSRSPAFETSGRGFARFAFPRPDGPALRKPRAKDAEGGRSPRTHRPPNPAKG